jgi:diaminohydroxyphosphoribosylaminopyrimidine deaminase/5-amino-6-(5-phosphoribosylamino)uracil reductase
VLDAAGELVGEGATQPPGGRHAEIVALDAAGTAASGGTLLCSLEPCSHTGRTGPCTDAIVAAGVSRVVYGVRDPHPIAAGGAEVLTSAGVDVESALELEAGESLRSWLSAQSAGRPFVTWKSAQSLDARVLAGDGGPVWLTSDEARLDGHRSLRAKADAIVVGSGTAQADHPSLTVRTGDSELDAHAPIRIVMDRSGVVSISGMRVSTATPADLLAELHSEGVVDVLIEGGPTLGSAFHRDGLVDRVVVYVAPVLVGASGPQAMVVEHHELTLIDATPVGPDLRLTYEVVR